MTETIDDEIICTIQSSLDSEVKPLKNILITCDYSNQYFDSLIICGDAKEELKKFPDNYFQCCITSPPYWGLRDYGITHQIGSEPKLDDYINNLVEVFREVRRTLSDDVTLWLNIGDSYTSGNRTWRDPDKKIPHEVWITGHLHPVD